MLCGILQQDVGEFHLFDSCFSVEIHSQMQIIVLFNCSNQDKMHNKKIVDSVIEYIICPATFQSFIIK